MYDGVGATTVLLLPGVVGNFVHVTTAERTLDWGGGSAVSAALDTDIYSAAGDVASTQASTLALRRLPLQRPCWHVVRVHHHCRSMAAQEVSCEQDGSHMSKTLGSRRGEPTTSTLRILWTWFGSKKNALGTQRRTFRRGVRIRCLVPPRRRPLTPPLCCVTSV